MFKPYQFIRLPKMFLRGIQLPSQVAWKKPTFFNVWRRTVVHSYSKKMLESGDKHIKKHKNSA
jgi:hypothetical protein